MKAGPYAVFDGQEYSCVSLHKPFVRLVAYGPEPSTQGFDKDHRGEWTRLVDRGEVSRLFFVETTALWDDYEVTVQRVKLDRAVIEHRGVGLPERPEIHVIENGVWRASVPVVSLTEVVEEVVEVPI